MQAWPAFLRVASKGVYAGGGSIAEGGEGRKPLSRRPSEGLGQGWPDRHSL